MTGDEGLGDPATAPLSCLQEAESCQELPESMFALLIRGCHGDRSRRGHPLVWLCKIIFPSSSLFEILVRAGVGSA